MNRRIKRYLFLTLLSAPFVSLPLYAIAEKHIDIVSSQSDVENEVVSAERKQTSEQPNDVATIQVNNEVNPDIKQSEKQPTKVTENTTQKNPLSSAMDSISSWWHSLQDSFKGNSWLTLIKNYFNNRSVKSILNSHALGIRNASQDQALARHLLPLSSKDKQIALNDLWAHVNIKKTQDEVKAIKNDSSLTPEQTHEKVEAVQNKFMAETEDISKIMKLSLKPTEFLSANADGSESQTFEIVDMTKIDPTQPLTQQYDIMEKSGDIKMSEKSLALIVTEFYANKVTLDLNLPVTEQIFTAIPDWDKFDGQLQINILSTLTARIPKQYLSPETKAQLESEQEELRKKDEQHARELREQLAKDKAALAAAKDPKKAAELEEVKATETADQLQLHAQEKQLVQEMEQQLAVTSAPAKKVDFKKNKKSTKKSSKKPVKEKAVDADAVGVVQ